MYYSVLFCIMLTTERPTSGWLPILLVEVPWWFIDSCTWIDIDTPDFVLRLLHPISVYTRGLYLQKEGLKKNDRVLHCCLQLLRTYILPPIGNS